MAGGLVRGEVRLYRFAAPDKQRPVVVLTRNSVLRYLNKVTVAPITSTIRGVSAEVILTEDDGMKAPCAVNLHNISSVPSNRMGRLIVELSPDTMSKICAAIRFSLGCD